MSTMLETELHFGTQNIPFIQVCFIHIPHLLLGIAMGASDVFDGLGIFIDTHSNSPNIYRKFPFVFYMMNDGKHTYKHDKDGGDLVIPGCKPSFKIVNTISPVKVVVSYNSGDLKMSMNEQDCFLASGLAKLNFEGYIGISAGTGAAYASHRIISLKTLKGPGTVSTEIHDEGDDLHWKLFLFLVFVASVSLLIFKFIKQIKVKFMFPN